MKNDAGSLLHPNSNRFLRILSIFLILLLIFKPTAFATENGIPYPDISIDENETGTFVSMNGDLICELRGNRYLRFRSTTSDQNWVGCERKPADLCIAFADAKATGLTVTATNHVNDAEAGKFTLSVTGVKPQLSKENIINYTITGTWMPDIGKFRYSYSTNMECDLEEWYENSATAQGYYNANPKSTPPIEITDYHIEQIAHTDRTQSTNFKDVPLRYEYFLSSEDGSSWEKWPKIHVPYPTRPGNYITIRKNGERMYEGAKFGFTDSEHGGWISTITNTTSGINFELCWYFFDVHILMYNAVPVRYSQERFSISFGIDFEPVSAQTGNTLLAGASERDWRSMEEYRLPLFTRNNTFDTMITDVPSSETAEHYTWWASSYDCYRDNTTGYDDTYSVTIKRDGNPTMPAAWNTYTWGHPFEDVNIKNHKYKLSAMVKTENCTGPVRLVYGVQKNSADLFYGTNTHNSDGTPRNDIIAWQYSDSLTGTNDWTPLALEFIVNSNVNSIILEQNGGGQVWFDNVVIEDLGEVTSENYVVYDDFLNGNITDWKINSYGSLTTTDNGLVISTDDQTLENTLRATRDVLPLGGRWVADIDVTIDTQRATVLACENIFNLEVNGSNLFVKTGDSSYNMVQTIFDSNFVRGTSISLKLIMDFDTKAFELYYKGARQNLGNGNFIRSGSVTTLKPFLLQINQGHSGSITVNKFMLYPDSDAGAVNITREDIKLDETVLYRKNIVLPTQGINNAEVMWSSSDPDIVSDSGIITRGNDIRQAELTANIIKNDASVQKKFSIRLAPYEGVSFSVINMTSGENCTSATISAVNDSAEEYDNAMVFEACYKNGELLAVDTKNVSLTSEAQLIELSAVHSGQTPDSVRFFIWENETLMPIAHSLDYEFTAQPYIVLSSDTADPGARVAYSAYEIQNGVTTELLTDDYIITSPGITVNYEDKTLAFEEPGLKTITISTPHGIASAMLLVHDSGKSVYVKGDSVFSSDFSSDSALSTFVRNPGEYTIESVDGKKVLATKSSSATYDTLLFGPEMTDYVVEMEYNMIKPIATGADAIGIGMRAVSNTNRSSYRVGFMERSKFGGDSVLYNRLAVGRAKGSNIGDTWYYASFTDEPLDIDRDTFYKMVASVCGNVVRVSLYDINGNLIATESVPAASCDFNKDGSNASALSSGKTLIYYHGLQAYISNVKIFGFETANRLRIVCSDNDKTVNVGESINLNLTAVTGNSVISLDNANVEYNALSGFEINGNTATATTAGNHYIIATYTDYSGNSKQSLIKLTVNPS